MKIVLFLASVATAMAATTNCGSSFKADGSDTVLPIAQMWATKYGNLCPNAKSSSISAGGSTVGATDVCSGKVDIGMMSRDWKSTEATAGSNGVYTCVSGKKKVIQVAVAKDGITIAAKAGGAAASCIKILGGLTVAQLNTIFSNAKSAPKWSDLNSKCSSSLIKITGPDSTSGTYSFFTGAVFTGSQTFRSDYSKTANADYSAVVKTIVSDGSYIGYMGYGYYVKNKSALTAAAIKNSAGAYVLPSASSISGGTYNPFSRFIYMNLLSTTLKNTKPYIDYGLSSAGSMDVTTAGFVPLTSTVIKQMLSRIGG